MMTGLTVTIERMVMNKLDITGFNREAEQYMQQRRIEAARRNGFNDVGAYLSSEKSHNGSANEIAEDTARMVHHLSGINDQLYWIKNLLAFAVVLFCFYVWKK